MEKGEQGRGRVFHRQSGIGRGQELPHLQQIGHKIGRGILRETGQDAQNAQITFLPIIPDPRGFAVVNVNPAISRQPLQRLAQGRDG